MSTPAHQDPQTIARAEQTLAWMKELAPSLRYAAMLTDDGFEVASLGNGVTDGSRMASMSSSVQALSDAVARELRIGLTDYVIIASSQGHVIQRRVPDRPIVVAALFDTYETLGKALSTAKRGAERMAEPSEPVAEPVNDPAPPPPVGVPMLNSPSPVLNSPSTVPPVPVQNMPSTAAHAASVWSA